MEKPLIIVDNDPVLCAIKAELDKGYEMLEESKKFMIKQAKENWNQMVKPHWDNIKYLLEEKKLLPDDFSEEKYSLSFKSGVLYLRDKKDNDLADLVFDALFGGKK